MLRASLDALVERHETLRTTFVEHDGAPVQVVHPPAPVALTELDLRHLPHGEREAERRAEEVALRPFDLARGPLLRAALFRPGEEDHVLCLTLHHIVGDGWSLRVLVRELSALYAAFSRGEAPRLPELPIQYADYAVWQREWLSGEVLEAQLAYWRERLAGAPPLLEVSTDRPRTVDPDARAGSHRFALAPETTRGLRALGRREGATLFMTLLAGWQALLDRYAGQEDVVVGSPVAGRTRRETEGLVGFFVNLLALRADLSGDPTWAELVGRTREAALGAYAHQDLPFERLVETLGVERSLTHTPLFQATFALDRSAVHEGLSLGEVRLEPFGTGASVAKFDLELTLAEEGEGLRGELLFRRALFEAPTIERMAGHLEIVLEAMAAMPGERLSGVSLLRGVERAQVLEAWNATTAAYPRDLCVHDLFAMQAARAPDAVALAWADDRVTYAELDRRSARLADALRRRGVGPEVRVGVCMQRTPELVVSLLAVLRAGGAYVPMDPGYPAERLRYMLSDSGAALLLADSAAAERLGDCGIEVLADGREECEVRSTEYSAFPESLACVVYTSGSTGTPKGVLGTHRAIVNRFAWMWSEYPFAPDEVCCQKTSLAFVDSVWEVFGPLLAGIPSVLVPDEDARDPQALAGAMSRHGVTRIVLVPSLLRALLDGGDDLGESCPRLRLVVTSGEELPAGLARRFVDAVPGATLLNLYGSSEVAADSTHHPLRVSDGMPGERVPIGRPIWNTRVYVVGAALEPVPTGAAGELYVAGDGLARGYMANPAATAERFVPDPFAAEPGGRMYRTGDRARWTADGELEYLGRADSQVKVRGFRIELGEIEAALRTHPAVREAVAVVREDAAGDRRIAAYVVADGGEAVSATELRAHLGARLPEYMVPGAFVALEQLPLTPNGKLDRLALPAPGERAGAGAEYVAPRTPTEEAVAAAWAETLGIGRVGAHDNFFDLGGHSLLLVQLHSRLQERFGAGVSLAELFGHATLADLARRLDELREEPAAAEDEQRRTLERAESRRARMARPRPG
ncbi:MAG TPA: amino acid adenylation domain-containing protein, partial [Longimicrobiaceae bacterium]